ncbi:MAG: TatD family hydrolase [bacterium]|nr:TatD family hydrolase [bacterium]
MIDTHAHIDADAFNEDRDAMLKRAWDAGMVAIVVPDIKPADRARLVEIVNSDPRIFRGIGIHPHDAGNASTADLDEIERHCTDGKVVAIGEIGLDYYYDFCPPDIQKLYFREQIRIAKRSGLPVIVHNRDSDDDVLGILEEEQDGTLNGVLHCFSGDTGILERALRIGLHISFTGNITFKRSTLDDVVRAVPTDRYMIETDSPYMTPAPHRGKRNEPTHVRLVAQKLAEIRGMTLDEIIDITTVTAKRFFAISLLFLVLCATAIAQPNVPNEDDFDTDFAYDNAMITYEADSLAWERWLKPRKLGIGFSLGSFTVVENQQFTQRFTRGEPPNNPKNWATFAEGTGAKRSFTYEGLIAFGGTLTYGLTDHWFVEGTYMYSKNVGPAESFGLDPIVTQLIETAVHYSLNPYGRVNFIAFTGVTTALIDDGTSSSTKFGVNYGMAIGVNLPTSFGLLYPMVSVRFNSMLGSDKGRVIERYPDLVTGELIENPDVPGQFSESRADISTLFALPRLTLLFYPKF